MRAFVNKNPYNCAQIKEIGDYDNNLNVAISEIGSVFRTLIINKIIPISNANVPKNIHLEFLAEGGLEIQNEKTVIISSYNGPPKKLFFGDGNVTFSENTNATLGEHFGAIGDGTNDSAALQKAISACSYSESAIKLVLLNKLYRANLMLHNGVHLMALDLFLNSTNSGGARIKPYGTGFAIDSAYNLLSASVKGVSFKGLGNSIAATGVRVSKGSRVMLSDLAFDDFADSAILINGGDHCIVERCMATDCLLNTTRTTKNGVLQIGLNAKNITVNNCDFSASLANKTNNDLYVCGVVLNGKECFLNNVEGHNSDIGIHIGGMMNRVIGCSAKLNFGHGFGIVGDENLIHSAHSYRNSMDGDNLYDGFNISGNSNSFNNCYALSYVNDNKGHRYGFYDSYASVSTVMRNVYSECRSKGHKTNWFFSMAHGGGGPQIPEKNVIIIPDGTTTPDVAQASFFELTNTASTEIENFINGVPGQNIMLLATNDNATILNNANILTNTRGDKVLLPYIFYHFIRYNDLWVEN